MAVAFFLLALLITIILLQLSTSANQNNTTRIIISPTKDPRDISKGILIKPKLNDKKELEFSNWKKTKTDDLLNYKPLSTLVKEKEKLNIGYYDLLNTIEWQFKRIKILVRDGYTCQNSECKMNGENLHVHHKCYMKNELPWEINESSLVSLCRTCHKKEHDNKIIPIYERRFDGTLVETENFNIYCSRCNGAGWFPQYKHVEDGVCFKCRGDCIERTIFSDAIDKFNSLDTELYENSILSEIINYFNRLDLPTYINCAGKQKVNEEDLPF